MDNGSYYSYITGTVVDGVLFASAEEIDKYKRAWFLMVQFEESMRRQDEFMHR